MVDRSQPLVVMPQACPFVALDGDRDQRLTVPDPMHRCFAEPTPKARSMGHQANFCLTPAFTGCPIFLDWASRVAADVVETLPAGAAAAASAAAGSGGAAALSGGAAVPVAGVPTVATSMPPASVPPVSLPPNGPRPVSTPPPSAAGTLPPASPTQAWVAESRPPPPDPVESASRRTTRVAIDAGPGPAAAPGVLSPDATVAAVAATSSYPVTTPPASAGVPGVPPTPTAPWSMSPDSDASAELAASMARTDLMVQGDDGQAAEPRASSTPDDEAAGGPPWSRGRPRVPMDAGAPASLGPQTRPGARPSGPREWEGARRFEAYAARAGSRRPGRPVLVAIGGVFVAIALLAVFLLPSVFHGGAAPTASPAPAASGATGTPRPRPTPTTPGATPEPPPTPEPTPGSYKIRRGDTLSSIGRKFNVTVAQLICANSIRNPNSLSTGTTLVIPIETYQCPQPTKKPKG